MIKEYRLGFRADNEILEGLEKLSKKLDVVQSEVIRIGIRKLMEDYLEIKSDIVVLERQKYDTIFNMLSNLLKEWTERKFKELTEQTRKDVLRHPKIQELMKLAGKGELEIEKS
jgi:Arc/MetJ-type ribon-helix-helix transcriptional regulator